MVCLDEARDARPSLVRVNMESIQELADIVERQEFLGNCISLRFSPCAFGALIVSSGPRTKFEGFWYVKSLEGMISSHGEEPTGFGAEFL